MWDTTVVNTDTEENSLSICECFPKCEHNTSIIGTYHKLCHIQEHSQPLSIIFSGPRPALPSECSHKCGIWQLSNLCVLTRKGQVSQICDVYMHLVKLTFWQSGKLQFVFINRTFLYANLHHQICLSWFRNCPVLLKLCKSMCGLTYVISSCSSVVTFNVGHVYSNPRTRGFWEVRQLGETPFPSVWVREQRDRRPVECLRWRHHRLWKFSTLFC